MLLSAWLLLLVLVLVCLLLFVVVLLFTGWANRLGNDRPGGQLTRLSGISPAARLAATRQKRTPKTRKALAAPLGPAAPWVVVLGVLFCLAAAGQAAGKIRRF